MESTIFVMQSFERALVSQFSQKTTEQQEDWNHNRCSLDHPQNYTPCLVTAGLRATIYGSPERRSVPVSSSSTVPAVRT